MLAQGTPSGLQVGGKNTKCISKAVEPKLKYCIIKFDKTAFGNYIK